MPETVNGEKTCDRKACFVYARWLLTNTETGKEGYFCGRHISAGYKSVAHSPNHVITIQEKKQEGDW